MISNDGWRKLDMFSLGYVTVFLYLASTTFFFLVFSIQVSFISV